MTPRALPTGAGRDTTGKAKVPAVESMACPARPGPHWLVNSAERGGLVTVCRGCRKSWSELDAEARASVGRRP